jgi:hypothetical protein
MKKMLPGAALGAAITALLAGCGGSDGGTGTGSGGGGSGATSFVGSDATVAAWADPVSLAFDGPASGTYAGARTFQRGNVDAMTGVDLGQPAGVEVWEGADGSVEIADLYGTSDPVAMPVSTETSSTIDPLCTSTGTSGGAPNFDYAGVYLAPDLASPTNTTYIYRLPGADGVCGTSDDVIHAVKTGMLATDAPLAAAAMPTATVYSSNGAILGFVAKSGASLVMEDASLANPVTLGTFPATVGVASPMPTGLVTGFASGRLFDVDGNIVFIDYTAHTVSASLFTIPNWNPANDHIVTAASPTTLYFAVVTPATGLIPASSTIYSMPNDGSAAPLPLSTLQGTVNQMEIAVGGSNLVVGVNTTTYVVDAFPLSGGAAVPLLVASGANDGRFTATANDIYWTAWFQTTSGGTTTRSNTASGINDMTGASVQAPLANSMFMVGGMTDPFSAGDTTTQRLPYATVFQVQNLTPVTVQLGAGTWTQDAIGGGTLSAIDTSSNTATTTLGTFPASTATTLAGGTVRGLDGTIFLQATNPLSTQDPSTRDLYLLNVSTAGSLTRVTDNL